MKKVFIAVVALVFAGAAQAQIGKNNRVVTPPSTKIVPASDTAATTSASKKKKEEKPPIKDMGTPTADEQKTIDRMEKKMEKVVKKMPPAPIKKF